MATRIAFSTHYPDRMKELAGKPTRFPEKLITMIDPDGENKKLDDLILQVLISGIYDFNFKVNYPPKTTTIRKNYEYWKSKEGQLLQPFFWAGKPGRSKHVVFCPEVRLAKVWEVGLDHKITDVIILTHRDLSDNIDSQVLIRSDRIKQFTENEGFDHPDHFRMWFNENFDGALLELESVEG